MSGTWEPPGASAKTTGRPSCTGDRAGNRARTAASRARHGAYTPATATLRQIDDGRDADPRTDGGRMRFGLDIAQHQLTWDEIVHRARLARKPGWTACGVRRLQGALRRSDGARRWRPGPCSRGWRAKTTSIRLGTLVTGMTHRHPSVLAAEVVTVDHLSNGRVECAIGAAWNELEHHELGIPFPPVAERMDRLEEGRAGDAEVVHRGSRDVRGALPPVGGRHVPAPAGPTAAPADLDRWDGASAHAADRGPLRRRVARLGRRRDGLPRDARHHRPGRRSSRPGPLDRSCEPRACRSARTGTRCGPPSAGWRPKGSVTW